MKYQLLPVKRELREEQTLFHHSNLGRSAGERTKQLVGKNQPQIRIA
jgi:hypothetical protein